MFVAWLAQVATSNLYSSQFRRGKMSGTGTPLAGIPHVERQGCNRRPGKDRQVSIYVQFAVFGNVKGIIDGIDGEAELEGWLAEFIMCQTCALALAHSVEAWML